jgi:hypothetical protein
VSDGVDRNYVNFLSLEFIGNQMEDVSLGDQMEDVSLGDQREDVSLGDQMEDVSLHWCKKLN